MTIITNPIMYIFALLPIITLISFSLAITTYNSCWRDKFIVTSIVLGIFITATTELLSLVRQLNFGFLILAWIILNVTLIFFYFKRKKSSISQLEAKTENQQLSWFLIILLSGIIFFLIVIGIIAIIAPPNTWDSMTYHMSRVVHWQQNKSIAHYPTYNLPQLFHPPFAEYAILHLQILTNSDRFANLVQWFSCVGSVIGVSLIAKQLQTNLRGQVFAAVFTVTIPMGILQASSTQNDYVVSFWIICLAYQVLKIRTVKKQLLSCLLIGGSLGLAILTKSSGYLYAFPFMVWYGLMQLKRWGWRGFQPVFISSSIALLLNLNHYLRNFELFGSFIAAPSNFASAYRMEVISFPTFISNILRNLALHADIIRNLNLQKFITPITGITEKVIIIIHNLLGISMYDPRTTAASYSGVPGISFNENVAGNPLHLFTIFLMLCIFLTIKKLRNNLTLMIYLLASISGFLLICLLLKIQIYQSRHHLALFLLLAAFVGVCLSAIPWQKLANIIIIIVFIYSSPWVFKNSFRPILAEKNIFNLTRIEQYFINRKQLQEPYTKATDLVKNRNCHDIGLSLGKGITVGNEYWEYPLWILLQNGDPLVRLEHIIPQNVSQSKAKQPPHNDFNPCMVIAVRAKKEPPISEIEFKGRTYKKIWSQEPVIVLE